MSRYRYRFTRDEIALMGTMSDRRLADLIGCSHPTVKREREERLIAPYDPAQPMRKQQRLVTAQGPAMRGDGKALASSLPLPQLIDADRGAAIRGDGVPLFRMDDVLRDLADVA